ncbi:hypothetical protein [Campylobacter concisus]|uniref:Phage Mu protein F-like protein n=1 Tax=Campylobacter concisus TaxID=199 RepID=A0A0M3V2I7_9BACT|nr:hypothetical protein [Campylobacter concisus]ALF47782.1 phage Mu protein F-like protein [Campylobacter concisus]
MNNELLLRTLLKAKFDKNKSVSELVDEFIKQNAKLAKKELEAQLANLLIFINENYNIDKKVLKELVNSKISSMGLSINPNNLEEIYAVLAGKNIAVNIVFDEIDIRAINAMRNNFYWVGKEFNKDFSDRLKDIIESAFRGEVARSELAQRLKDEFASELKQSVRYFEGVSDHIISQNQNISTVNQARKYGVKYYKVVAVMDSRTSAICRSMNGRLIPAEHIERQCDNIMNAKDMASKKAAATWAKAPYNGRSDKMDSNFGMPPYHFRCRTEIVPAWVDEYENDGVTMRASEAPGKDEIIRHIDKMGVERVLTFVNANDKKHSANLLQRTSAAKIVSALNSITHIAPHTNVEQKSIAKTQNGYIIIFDGDKIDTIFPTKDNQALKKYFENYAKKDKIEVIKRWWQI